MARIILGIGASNTPLLTLTSEQWAHRAAADFANPELNLSDGRLLTYGQLLAEAGPRYADVVTPEILDRKAQACSDALDRLGDALEAAAPDVVVIVGDARHPARRAEFRFVRDPQLGRGSRRRAGAALALAGLPGAVPHACGHRRRCGLRRLGEA